MPAIRLCILGGASSYTHHMLRTFSCHVASGDLAGSSVIIYDIDKEAAKLMAAFADSVAKARNLDFSIKTVEQMEEAMEGADFVFSSVRVGGHEQLQIDEEIPIKYGILGQETTGVSGTFMICRQAPVHTQFIETMQKVCSGACLINYSNPTGMICGLMQRISNTKCVGLCDGVYDLKYLMCYLMDLPFQEASSFDAYVAGVNHCTWTLGLLYKGQDIYPEVGELLRKYNIERLKDKNPWWHMVISQMKQVYLCYNLLPGSVAYCWYQLYTNTAIDMFSRGTTTRVWKHVSQQKRDVYKFIHEQVGKPDADFMPWDPDAAAHGDIAVGAVHKMACDTGEIEIANVMNNGAVSNLPDDAIVEVPCVLRRNGVFPLRIGPLPTSVIGKVYATNIHYKLSVDAALEGSREKLVQAAMSYPSNVQLDKMEKCIDELFEMQKDWLPQFNLKFDKGFSANSLV